MGRKGFYYVSSDNSLFSSVRAFWAMDGDFINYGIRSLNVIFKFGLMYVNTPYFRAICSFIQQFVITCVPCEVFF